MDYALLEAAPDAILISADDGRIVFANAQASRLFGYDRDVLVGRPFETLVAPRHRVEAARRHAACVEARADRPVQSRLDVRGLRGDGSECRVEIVFRAFDTDDGRHVISAIRDIKGRKRSEEKFRSLLESAPDAMVITGEDGRIVLVNAQTERLFGYSRAELLGQPVEMLVPHRFRHSHVSDRDTYRTNAHARPMGAGMELFAVRKDGSEFPVEISLSPLNTDEGMLVASAIRDVTDRKVADAERARLVEERAAHAEASRVKDEFLATLSHELRTPLNAILGWTAMLRTATLDATRTAHALDTIERNARAQAQLVEDLLDLSRIITGKMHLERLPVDLASVLDAAADVVSPGAHAKRITLEVVAERRPVLLLADADRLQQAIWNLLTNAVKFTPGGGRVEAKLRVSDSTATVVVRDSGVGIDPAFLPHVFDRFRQQDGSATRTHGGLGLGLSIVRSVIEAHGGQIRAASGGAGKGATFTIDLPLVETLERRAAPARPAPELTDHLAGVRVLVVEDTPDDRELFAEILGQSRATVVTATTVAEAMERIGEFLPHVIVSDIAMPLEDGYVLLRKLRDHPDPRVTRIPAMAVTAHARADDRRRAITAGFQRYVSKPVEPLHLVNAVASLVEAAAAPALGDREP